MAELGSFWERKIRTHFKIIDFDKDGALSRKDYETMAERFIEVGQLSEVASKKVKRKYSQVWDKMFAAEANEGKVTLDVFLSSARKSGKTNLMRVINEIFLIMFDLIDVGGDGVITKKEFEMFYKILGLDAQAAAETFKVIDLKGDGILSEDEFITAAIDYFCSEDETSPYRFLYGPLI